MDDLISKQAAKDMIKNHKTDFNTEKDYRIAMACVNALPSAQPGCEDAVSRKAAIDAVNERIKQIGYEKDQLALSIRQAVRELPSAQPETHDKRTKTRACDSISRQVMIDAIDEVYNAIKTVPSVKNERKTRVMEVILISALAGFIGVLVGMLFKSKILDDIQDEQRRWVKTIWQNMGRMIEDCDIMRARIYTLEQKLKDREDDGK